LEMAAKELNSVFETRNASLFFHTAKEAVT
jgi:hypothetical protein